MLNEHHYFIGIMLLHQKKIQIYYEDIDIGGIVYHANYIKYLERARTDFMLERGLNLGELLKEGIQFVVRDLSVRYLKPSTLHDELTVKTSLSNISGASLHFGQFIELDETSGGRLCEAKVLVVCVNALMKPQRMPERLKRSLCES